MKTMKHLFACATFLLCSFFGVEVYGAVLTNDCSSQFDEQMSKA